MISYRGDEAIDWFGFSRLWSQTVGYAKTTSRIDSWNRRKTLSEGLASAGLLFFDKGDDVCMSNESCDLLYDVAVCVERTDAVLLHLYIWLQETVIYHQLILSPGEVSTSCWVSIFEGC